MCSDGGGVLRFRNVDRHGVDGVVCDRARMILPTTALFHSGSGGCVESSRRTSVMHCLSTTCNYTQSQR